MTDPVGIRDKAFLVDTDDGRASWFGRTLVVDRVIAKCTENAYSALEQHAPPGYESTYHINHAEKEIRYMLDGQIEVVTEGATFTASSGQTVVCKQGEPHGWRVAGDDTARTLVIYSPSGFEELYHKAGESAADRSVPGTQQSAEADISGHSDKYNLEILDQELRND